MFEEVAYDTQHKHNWRDISRNACDQEFEQRTKLIKWSRALDHDFDYESHKEALEYFGYQDNISFTDGEVYESMIKEEQDELENQQEEECLDDLNEFKKHREVLLLRHFCDFNHDFKRKCLFKTKGKLMSPQWQEELIELWEEGDYEGKNRNIGIPW